MREQRRHLDGHEPIAPADGVVHGPQHVRGTADIADREIPERVLDRVTFTLGGGDQLVVALAAGDRFLEDGGVRRDATDAVVAYQFSQSTAVDQRVGDVVVPGALTEVVEPSDLTRH